MLLAQRIWNLQQVSTTASLVQGTALQDWGEEEQQFPHKHQLPHCDARGDEFALLDQDPHQQIENAEGSQSGEWEDLRSPSESTKGSQKRG